MYSRRGRCTLWNLFEKRVGYRGYRGHNDRGRGLNSRGWNDRGNNPNRGRGGAGRSKVKAGSAFEVLGNPYAVAAAIVNNSRSRYGTLFLQDDRVDIFEGNISQKQVYRAAKALGIPVEYRPRPFLDDICEYHRGAALECFPVEPCRTKADSSKWDIVEGNKRVVLVLDQIHDPQNFGAMLRTALFLGVDEVVVTQKGSVPPTAAVSRISTGALECLVGDGRLSVVHGPLSEFLSGLAEKRWRVVATVAGEESRLEKLVNTKGDSVALVMGNEAVGLRSGIKEVCTDFVTIPNRSVSALHSVDSLNVSVACAIILNDLVRE